MAKYPEITRSQEGSFGPSLSFVVSLYSLELSAGKVAVVIVETGIVDILTALKGDVSSG